MAAIRNLLTAFVRWFRTEGGLLHFFASAFLVVFLAGVVAPAWAVLLTFVLGILKEIADYILPNHSADMKDIFCDIIGIGAGTILVGLQIWLAALLV